MIMSHRKDTDDTPKLQFNRAWSAPGKKYTDPEIIAQVLSDPTFEDILACAVHFGLKKTQAVYLTMLSNGELSSGAASIVRRSLKNIEIGYLRAQIDQQSSTSD